MKSNLFFRSASRFCAVLAAAASMNTAFITPSHAQSVGIVGGDVTLSDQLVLECLMLNSSTEQTRHTFYQIARQALNSQSATNNDRQNFDRAVAGEIPMNCHRIVQLIRYKNHMDLSHSEISDLFLLSHLHGLRSLQLDNNNITDLAPLANLENLETLTLSHNSVKDVQALARLPRLKFLVLHNTNVSKAVPLAYSRSLIRVDLRNTHVTDVAEARRIAEVVRTTNPLPTNPPLNGSPSVVFNNRPLNFVGP